MADIKEYKKAKGNQINARFGEFQAFTEKLHDKQDQAEEQKKV